MSIYAAPDQRALELNRRARLLREAARRLPRDPKLRGALFAEADTVAAEAMMLVLEDGAQPGESYHHYEDDDRPCLGPIMRSVSQVDPGGAL